MAGPTDDDGWGDAADLEGAGEPETPAEPAEPAEESERPTEISGTLTTPEPPPSAPTPPAEPAPVASSPDDWDAAPPESLAEAAGIDSGPRKSKPPRRRRLSTRGRVIAAGVVLVVLLLGAGGFSSWLNSRHYYVACTGDAIRAERGRFWPWGRAPLEGDKWRPIPVVDECREREVAGPEALESELLSEIQSRADGLLSKQPPEDLDAASKLLEQGLLLSRSPAQRDARKAIKRLMGDVEYWRARAEVDAAIASLKDARDKLDAAAAKQLRHVADAGTWVAFLDGLLERAKAGPGGEPASESDQGETPAPANGGASTEPGDETPTAPPATAPDLGDAGTPEPTPDAPLPRGGVLL